jgi:hypothetical protein
MTRVLHGERLLARRAKWAGRQSKIRFHADGYAAGPEQPMTAANLNALEQDVEQARARFANDLAQLRSPTNLTRFKDDLWAEARETKDELLEKGKEAAKDAVQRLAAELKDRAAANPAAALAIGAGLAWRLFNRPPIATALVGMGLYSLLRTTPRNEARNLTWISMTKIRDRHITMMTAGWLRRPRSLVTPRDRRFRIGAPRPAKRRAKWPLRSVIKLHR